MKKLNQSEKITNTSLVIPTTAQQQWHDMELGMFFHFDIPIYKPGWDWRSWKDLPDPDLYQPHKLDTDQWMEAAQAMGAKYAILVAKHCSGFCQWQTDIYPYGVNASHDRLQHLLPAMGAVHIPSACFSGAWRLTTACITGSSNRPL